MLVARLLYRKIRKYIRHETRNKLTLTKQCVLLLIKSQIRTLKSNANVRFWGERSVDSLFLQFDFMLLGKYFQSSRRLEGFTIL